MSPKRAEPKKAEDLSEQEMLDVLRQAQQARGEQALAVYRRTLEGIRQQFGFDVQPFAVIEVGRIVMDVKLVAIPGWQAPPPMPVAPPPERDAAVSS